MSRHSNLYRSLTKSVNEPIKLKVKGNIPNWLNGTLYRNGPGRFDFGNKKYQHLFDGQSCVHKFKIKNGEIYYTNKLLETQSYLKTLKNNRLYSFFGKSDTDSALLDAFKFFLIPQETFDNVNVSVIPYNFNQLYALTETHLMCKLDPADLNIIETINITNYIKSLRTVIAHPHVEHDGSWITMGINPMVLKTARAHYEFIRYKPGGKNACEKAQLIASIPSNNRFGYSYFHSFAITQNYIIFLEQCLQVSYRHVIKSLILNQPRSTGLVVNEDMPTRIHVINKRTGEVINKKLITDPQVTLHHINAYETENNQIFLDVCSFESKGFNIELFTFDEMFSRDKSVVRSKLRVTAKRIHIDLNNNENSKEIYCDIKCLKKNLEFELPSINYWKYNGKAYKYAYGTTTYTIIKLNVENENDFYEIDYNKDLTNACLPNEPIFVERPNAVKEDDGVLLVMVLGEKYDYLSILDASNLTEIARAEAPENVRGAFTFHGFFADEKNFNHLT